MATCKDCLVYQFCKANRTLDYSNYLGCVNVESNCKLFIQSSISTDYISRSRLLRDPYFQEGRYPESPLLRMAIGEQPAVHVVPVNYVLSNIPKMTASNPVVTNGDKIRAMSDEELADWLLSVMKHGVACFAEGAFPYAPCRNEDHNCLQCGVAWLKQPAEV